MFRNSGRCPQGACPNCRTANAALGTSNCRAKPLSWQVAQARKSEPIKMQTQDIKRYMNPTRRHRAEKQPLDSNFPKCILRASQDVGSRPLDLETQYRFLAVLCQDPEAATAPESFHHFLHCLPRVVDGTHSPVKINCPAISQSWIPQALVSLC